MSERPKEKRERWPTTTSVAIVIKNSERTLLLVRKKDTGLWSLPAGGLLKGEQPVEAARRELREETGLGPDDVTDFYFSKTFVIPSETKTSIGFVYVVDVNKPLPKEGIKPNGDEIDWVRPFPNNELVKLLQTPGKIYKPGFNIPVIEFWFGWCLEF